MVAKATRRRAFGLWVMLCVTGILLGSRPGAAQPLEQKSTHYTVFYEPGYEQDAAFTRLWMDRTETVMKEKYGIVPAGYAIDVRLLSAPADGIDPARSGELRCCTPLESGTRTGTIRLLARSAPIWKKQDLKSSLGLSKRGDDYHAKVLVSEYIPVAYSVVQSSRPTGAWSFNSAPQWFVQGLEEYDAIVHSTNINRTQTYRQLLQWANRNPGTFKCCDTGLVIGDAYNGGAAFVAFLAAEFGEDVHRRILQSARPSFEQALAEATGPYTLPDLVERFKRWLDLQT